MTWTRWRAARRCRATPCWGACPTVYSPDRPTPWVSASRRAMRSTALSFTTTPGHTAGHVVFWRERDGVAIAGDVLNAMDLRTSLTGLHEPPGPFSRDPAQNRRSIRKLAEMDPQILCCGHGPVWRDRPKFKDFVRRLPQD
ncbi:MAG: MBL fold metallo-hydrolase [Candidatus Dormibacteria bacterium]